MRGLPFQIGGGDGNCYVALDGSAGPVTIPVGGNARQVIFAHALLETAVPLGGKLGIAVADYVFHLCGRGARNACRCARGTRLRLCRSQGRFSACRPARSGL